MPKVKRQGKTPGRGPPQKPPKGEAAAEAAEEAEAGEGPQKCSRGQRKRREKKEGFLRKFEFVNSALREDPKHELGFLGDLDGLAAAADLAIQEGGASASEADIGKKKRPMSRKAQALATEREINQYQQVMKVEAFQKDPLGALEQHLKNSIKKQRQEIKERQEKAKRAKPPVKPKASKRHAAAPGKQAAGPAGVIKSTLKKRAAAKPKKMEVE